MKVKEKKWIRFRIYLVAFFFLAGLGTILARAYQLQVLERDRLASIALAGYRGTIKLLPKRGTIYDREGHELAVSVEVESVYAHPNLVKRKNDAAKELSRALNLNRRKILGLLRGDSPFVWIKRKISPKEVKRVRALGLEGVGFTTETRRYYPGREIGAHVIGFAGADNQGLEGLERKYDAVLKGPEHTLVKMRDALGRPFYISRPTSKGPEMHDLVLTIDKDIQYRAQQALQRAVTKTRAKSGHCIILNPETGEILAMAVVPLFNPNIFWKYKPDQWRNRAITDSYEPGSTLKTFLLSAALESRIVSPRTTFYCEEGKFQFASHIIHDTKGFGTLTVSDIIVFSSNIGAVKMGQKLGYEKFLTYLEKFGFGSKTGIDLNGEISGFIRPSNQAKEIDRANLFFGQGMTASSLQIALAMAAIANGGELMRPFVVKAIRDQSGRVVKEMKPQVIRKVISTKTARNVARILEGVVSEDGTAPLAAISGYRVAGKTGTSQKVDPRTRSYSNKDYVAIFVGFVPADKPRMVILMTVDEPEGKPYGGLVAGPAFQEVGTWALNYLGITPQVKLAAAKIEPETQGPKVSRLIHRPRTLEKKPGLLPDFRGQSMREVLIGGKALGLNVVLEGTGLAVRQTPQPGSSLKKIDTVKVSFRPPR
ncbi:MAG: transpeptidase family protein [Deltaproteobacteria bacterium]|nr:MAG: transpeptidase family protein [Deltaproteobacteria bacterium]